MIESLKVFDTNVLNIASVANSALAVVMPIVHHGLHTLHQYAGRTVLAHLVFIAHNAHFAV